MSYISERLRIQPENQKRFFYIVNPEKNGSYAVTYKTMRGDMANNISNSSYTIAQLMFSGMPDSDCIRYSDIQPLFDKSVEKIAGNLSPTFYRFKKTISAEYDQVVTLNVPYLDSGCALVIEISMLKNIQHK